MKIELTKEESNVLERVNKLPSGTILYTINKHTQEGSLLIKNSSLRWIRISNGYTYISSEIIEYSSSIEVVDIKKVIIESLRKLK